MRYYADFLIYMFLVWGLLPAAFAVPVYIESKLVPNDLIANVSFGASVTISGDHLVVASGGNGFRKGEIYVYHYDGTEWSQTTKLLSLNREINLTLVGAPSVSLSGNLLAVGEHSDDEGGEDTGAVYIFTFDNNEWVQTAKLLAPDGAPFDHFGQKVALSGNRLVVGTKYTDDLGSNSGSAYIFDYDGNSWVQTAKLFANDGAVNSYFGNSVAIDGDRVVVGTINAEIDPKDPLERRMGAAYVFTFDGSNWVQTVKLLADDGDWDDFFSHSVAINGNRLVVGAAFNNVMGKSTGSAYVFTFDGSNWIQTEKLLSDNGEGGEFFGYAVAVHGERIVVGANSTEGFNQDETGSVYVFDYDGSGWIQTSKLLASDRDRLDRFGHTVAFDGDWIVAGAITDDALGVDSGSAYIFKRMEVIDPLADVKVNGKDGPLTLVRDSREMILSTQLFAGETTGDVDYWLFAETPLGRFSYDRKTDRWLPGMQTTAQGSIKDVLLEIHKRLGVGFPLGTSVIMFGVDLNPNGLLDEPMFLDTLELTITAQ